MAKTVNNYAAQGDFLIMRIKDIPNDVVTVEPTDGKHIVAHSETGHNHTMVMERTTVYKEPLTKDEDIFRLFLAVEAPTEIIHERSYHTHDPLTVPPGNYEIRRQREYTAEGFRRAQD